MKNVIIASFILTLLIYSCGSQKNEILEYYSYETECLGVELDGSQTLRALGKGKNKKDAIEQAEKNALNDVMFKGIRKGKSECSMIPLVVEVNARNNHEKYFNNFFEKNRIYSKYISYKDGSFKEKHSSDTEVVYGITVRVLRSKLKKRLIKDDIIKL